MHVAVLQQARQIAEITDRAQTLQLLSHVALLPTAVTSPHLDGRSHKEAKKRLRDRPQSTSTGTFSSSTTCKLGFRLTTFSSPHSTIQCTGTCSGVYRTPPFCLHSGCAASSGWSQSSMCRDARDGHCYGMSAHTERAAYSLEHKLIRHINMLHTDRTILLTLVHKTVNGDLQRKRNQLAKNISRFVDCLLWGRVVSSRDQSYHHVN